MIFNAVQGILIDFHSDKILYEFDPDAQIYPASMTKIMTSIVAFDLLKMDWHYALSGSFVFAGFLFGIGLIGQFILKKESIGFGDVKLGLVLGGFLGVEYSILALYLSFAISAISVLFMYLGKMKVKDTKIPFGPYLAAGTLISLFTITTNGENYILNWYYSTMF